MITLRELIEEIIRLDALPKVAKEITKIHSVWNDKPIEDVTKAFKSVCDELVDLPGVEPGDNVCIAIIKNDTADDVVSCHTVVYEDDGDHFSMDFIDWNDLIDLPVRDDVCCMLSERLANILYEITFWGYTRASITQQAEELRRAAEDKDNLIEISMEDFLAECDSLK